MDCALKQFMMKHIQVNQLLFDDPFISLKILPLVCNVITVNKILPITSWFVLEYLIVCFDPDYVIFADFYGQ